MGLIPSTLTPYLKRGVIAVRRLAGARLGDAAMPAGWGGLYLDPLTGRLRLTELEHGDRAIETTGGGTGDVVGPAASVDAEVALFSGTTGKLLKRAAITGLAKLTSGVLSAASAGTDYYAPGSTDVAVADGGTGSSTAAGACTNLGAIPTSTLTTADDILIRDGSGPTRLAAGRRGAAPMIDPLSGSLAYVAVASMPMRAIACNGTSIVSLFAGTSLLGTITDTSDSTGQWGQFGGSTSGTNYGVGYTVGKIGTTPFLWDAVIRSPPGLLKRLWFGVSQSQPGNSDTPSNNSAFIAYRDGTDSQWVALTRDGTTTASPQNIAAIATSTLYRLRIRYDGTNYYMRVNNSAEVTCSGNLPAAGTTASAWLVITSDGSARSFELSCSTFRAQLPAI